MNVLFVSWDGPQVSYLQGLFLPIFKELTSKGFRFHVLQFTWGDSAAIERSKVACENIGISYRSVRVWRKLRAAGAMVTAVAGARLMRQALEEHSVDVVLARSTLPALTAMLSLGRSPRKFAFDADGLPLDERVEFAGDSASSLSQRFLRDVEAQAVRRADVVLTRSQKAVEILEARAGAGTHREKFHVVGNGRDTQLFRPGEAHNRGLLRKELGIAADAPVLAYAGSMGDQYCTEEMLQLFMHVQKRRPDSHLLVLTGDPQFAKRLLNERPALSSHASILCLPPHEVPPYLACADLGLALRKPSFSMQAVAPIKLGEYLLCGLPVVAINGVGDTGSLSPEVAMLLRQTDETALEEAADWFVREVIPQRDRFRENSREFGLRFFSLTASVEAYERALRHAVS